MKLLIFITGRGTGGDAVTAYNIREALLNKGIESEIVLDTNAPGYYFKKRGISWLKSPIPNAGGHAASKIKLLKAGLKTINAGIKGARLVKKQKADGVIGVIGGGAVIGMLSAKLARVPSVSYVSTPTDTRVSLKMNPTILLPESPLYTKDNFTSKYDVIKEYLPIKSDIVNGNRNNILDKLTDKFNPDKKSVLFSSGSTLFDDMAKAARRYAEENDDVNIFVIGAPLRDDLNEIIDHPNIINLGYINFIDDLYDLIDIAIITDDGLTLHETIVCEIPVVVVIGVKYGRYHNLASIFKGAVLESHVDNISEVVNEALEKEEDMKESTKLYSETIKNATDNGVEFIKKHME